MTWCVRYLLWGDRALILDLVLAHMLLLLPGAVQEWYRSADHCAHKHQVQGMERPCSPSVLWYWSQYVVSNLLY
jgi:hypothetical protein